jgi:glycosyltransferase involved in cell wall biosynthesis
MTNKKKILIFIDWFLPGIKAGGPIKSVSALVNHLNSEFDFYIITSNTDFGDKQAYKNLESNAWLDFKFGVKVIYYAKGKLNKAEIKNQINRIQPDVVYLNSFFSYTFSILPLLVLNKLSFNGKIILAPRGMLAEGALKIKPFKKRIFLAISKQIKLHKHIIWHSTKIDETEDIKRNFKNARVTEIQNIPNIQLKKEISELTKKPGELRLIYLGRIAKNKNLKKVLEVLSLIKNAEIDLSIYGFIEDELYWNECQNLIADFTKKIKAEYKGILNEEEVQQQLIQHHYLIMLSYSENFGHAIVEALSCGTPVIIGENTPWQELEKNHAGWNVNINDNENILKAITNAVSCENGIFKMQQKNSLNYAAEKSHSNQLIFDYKKMFN